MTTWANTFRALAADQARQDAEAEASRARLQTLAKRIRTHVEQKRSA
jgi:hypothetical protein